MLNVYTLEVICYTHVISKKSLTRNRNYTPFVYVLQFYFCWVPLHMNNSTK